MINTKRTWIITDKAGKVIDWSIVAMAFLSGLLHPSPALFYSSMLRVFAIIIIPLLSFSYLFYLYTQRNGKRIQGERKIPLLIGKEIFGTTRAMFIVSAWQHGRWACIEPGYQRVLPGRWRKWA